MTVTVCRPSNLTNTSYCPLPNNRFRLLYRLEEAPNIYRLQASNPGQFYYNVMYQGEPGSEVTLSIQIPWPFVTQEGAGVPIQVHDWVSLNDNNCLSPSERLNGYTITTPALTPTSSSGNQIITPEDYAAQQIGQFTTVTVSGVVPDTGLMYVTIHLDYGLKKTSGWKNPGTYVTENGVLYPDARNDGLSVTILGIQPYSFSWTDGTNTYASTPESTNEFKKFAGFLGIVTDSVSGEPLEGIQVSIMGPDGNLLPGTPILTDEDGYYFLEYKHKGRSNTYTVSLPGYPVQPVEVPIKANGFAGVDFEITP